MFGERGEESWLTDDGTRNFCFDLNSSAVGFYSTDTTLSLAHLRRGLGDDVPGDAHVEGPDLLSGGNDLLVCSGFNDVCP